MLNNTYKHVYPWKKFRAGFRREFPVLLNVSGFPAVHVYPWKEFRVGFRRRQIPFWLSVCIVQHTESQASVHDLAPLNFRRRVTRPVSYYALF